jgi:hypothetical protein
MILNVRADRLARKRSRTTRMAWLRLRKSGLATKPIANKQKLLRLGVRREKRDMAKVFVEARPKAGRRRVQSKTMLSKRKAIEFSKRSRPRKRR